MCCVDEVLLEGCSSTDSPEGFSSEPSASTRVECWDREWQVEKVCVASISQETKAQPTGNGKRWAREFFFFLPCKYECS